MSIYSKSQRDTIVLSLLLVLGAFILYSLRVLTGALLSTVVLYTIFRPLNIFLTQNWKINKSLSAVLIMLLSLGIIVMPFLTLSMMVVSKISTFQQQPELLKITIQKFEAYVGDTFHVPHVLEKLVPKLNEYAAGLFPALVSGAADIFLGLLVMYFLLYFMFTHYQDFEKGLINFAPFEKNDAIEFGTELRNTTYSNVLGQGLIAIVQGGLVSLGFLLFGIPDALFWGTIATFLSFLPVVGAPLVFIPAAIIQLANGHPSAGWGLLIWGLVLITNIDNVIRFLLAKRIANMHPIITVVGVIIGIPTFGILGLVFGPLLLAYFILTLRIYQHRELKK